MPWHVFLDEAAAAGYTAVELGPFGYLPTEPERLRDELGQRGLSLTGATAGTALYRGGDALVECREVAGLLVEMGVAHLVTLPVMYTDLYTGELLEPADLAAEQWQTLGNGHTELGRILLLEEHGEGRCSTARRRPRRHRGPDHPVPRGHRPSTDSLCLDTGHVAYAGGDNRAIVAAHPDRIGYVHLKSVDPVVLQRVRDERMWFADAVKSGVMVEPDAGEPAMPALSPT